MGKPPQLRSDEVTHGPKLGRSSRGRNSTVGNLCQQTEKWSEGRPVTTKKYFSGLNIS